MHDVAWRGMWICVRSKDAQKQLARTSLNRQATQAKVVVNLKHEKRQAWMGLEPMTCANTCAVFYELSSELHSSLVYSLVFFNIYG